VTTTRTTATRRYTLPFGDLLGQTLSIYFRNFVPFTVLGAIVMAPWAAIWLPAQSILDPDGGRIDRGDFGKFLLLQIGAFIAQMLLTYLLTGAVTYGVVQQMRGQPAGIGQAVAHGFKNLGRALGTGILFLVRWLLFSLLLVVPGIMEFCRLYVAVPAAVMEGRGGGQAIERSKLLTDGSRWPIFGALVVVGMGLAMISGVVAAIVMIATGGPRSGSGMAVNIVMIALTVVSQGLQATMTAVTYFLLRRGKENADPAALASVFD
jgi:uncharacterized membrane protein